MMHKIRLREPQVPYKNNGIMPSAMRRDPMFIVNPFFAPHIHIHADTHTFPARCNYAMTGADMRHAKQTSTDRPTLILLVEIVLSL